MKAVVLHETGPADNLSFEDVDKPALMKGHALVRVKAAGVCYRDIVDRRGGFPFMKKPVIPGHELAGVVEAVADDVTELTVGQRVCNMHRAPCGECEYCKAGHTPRCSMSPMMFGLTMDGGYAEYVLAPAGCLVPLPDGVSFEHGCFLFCTAAVALRGMRTRGGLREGQSVLITGASGGVGIHAIQVAKAMGARVFAVTSSEHKAQRLTDMGADEVIVTAELKFHKEVKSRSGGGVHVVLDCVGPPTLHGSIRSLRPMGTVVICGNVTISRQEFNPGYFILTEVGVCGTSSATRQDLEQVLSWVAEGKVKPQLDEVLPLSAAADAHKRLENKAVQGRLVLAP